MADRKGKARAWSARRAERAYWRDAIRSDEVGALSAQTHLSRAYLAGFKAAQAACYFDSDADLLGELHVSEQTRLGMSPQAKRKRKSGEGR